MAEGPRLPRKATALRRAHETIEVVAYQIGVLLAIQRNRNKLTQEDLAAEVGVDQIDVSRLENGEPSGLSNAKIDAVFSGLT